MLVLCASAQRHRRYFLLNNKAVKKKGHPQTRTIRIRGAVFIPNFLPPRMCTACDCSPAAGFHLIPEELLAEVLRHLPARSLALCANVSRAWEAVLGVAIQTRAELLGLVLPRVQTGWPQPFRLLVAEDPAAAWRGVKCSAALASAASPGDCLALHEDGEHLISVGADHDARVVSVFSLERNTLLGALRGHVEAVCCVAVEGDVVAAGAEDGTIRLWQLAARGSDINPRPMATLHGHTGALAGLTMWEGCLASGGADDRSVRTWSIAEGWRCTSTRLGHTHAVTSVSCGGRSTTGQRLLISGSTDRTARVWELTHAEPNSARTLRHLSYVLSVSAVGNTLACACVDSIVVWSLCEFERLYKVEHGNVCSCVRLSRADRAPGGLLLLSGGHDRKAKLWTLERPGGTIIATLEGHAGSVRGLAISAAGVAASCGIGGGGQLFVWHACGKGGCSPTDDAAGPGRIREDAHT